MKTVSLPIQKSAATVESFLALFFFNFFIRCLHSPPLIWISSSKFKKFYNPYLVVQIDWGYFFVISDSLSQVSSSIWAFCHKILTMQILLFRSFFTPRSSILMGLNSSVKSFLTSIGTWGRIQVGSTSAFLNKETWNTSWTLANCGGKSTL